MAALKRAWKIDGSPHDDVVSPLLNLSPLFNTSPLLNTSPPILISTSFSSEKAGRVPAPCQYAHKMEVAEQEARQDGIPANVPGSVGSKRSSLTKGDA